ncbi:MAG: fumarylacetoacetate hydrolase family protein [Bacteroidales bacterium]|nr:fumarylacetoacetate hydrolase family protein [Bacteroidales bacterium]
MNVIVLYPHGTAQHDAIFYTLPETVVLKNGKPLFIPNELSPLSADLHLGVRISNLGRSISERFAHRYYDAISAVPQFYSASVLEEVQAKGLPWSFATEFDGAVPLGGWFLLEENRETEYTLKLEIDEISASCIQVRNIDILIAQAIARVSRMYTLRRGDLLLIKVSETPIPVAINQHIDTYVGREKVLSFNLK